MAEKTKAPSKNHKWDAKNKRWVLKTFEERQKGRNILLQGKNNPIRVVHDTIRNVNAAKEVRKKDSLKPNNKSNNTESNTKPNPKSKLTFKNMKEAGLLDKKSKSTTGGKKKKITARSRMEARNREIHGDDKIDALKDRHTAWKKARKEGTLAEWEKTYHPNRTPQYSKKTKKVTKAEKNKAALKAGKVEREANEWGPGGQPKASEQMKKYKPKKKKTERQKKNEIKYPTRGTFRGI